ncbi:hypothetical protein WJX81_002864 [Elliptochloris bilobata]|uniref:Extradiol ring-cleavage dioxygenase class III enzyme subunit B domain-containing protein n=1 Tax=Elliptochloris bilobata TaxID=381761 RepID=A0AAW1QUN5_9CHLO
MNGTVPKMPAYFLAHGGGPMPLFNDPSHEGLIEHLRGLEAALPHPPRALVVISAHWETAKPTVTSGQQPELIYDYSSFPKEAYEVKYAAPGEPALAHRIVELLRGTGIDAAEDSARGWDHGVFVPLKLAFPAAALPVVELSVLSSLDPEAHVAIGEALAPLRDEGVLLLGSGLSFHNMSSFMRARKAESIGNVSQGIILLKGAAEKAKEFDAALAGVLTDPAHSREERRAALVRWAELPEARFAQPREEHLLPLHVVAGAAKCGVATADFSGDLMGVKVSAFKFA